MPRKQSLAAKVLALATSSGTNGITSSEIVQAFPDHSETVVRQTLYNLVSSRHMRVSNRSRRSVIRSCMFNNVYELAQSAAVQPVTTTASARTTTATRRGRPTEAVRQKRIRDAIALLKKAGIKKVA